MGDSLKRQIPTVGSRRWEDKQQREFFSWQLLYGREQKLKKKEKEEQRLRDPAECLRRKGREEAE